MKCNLLFLVAFLMYGSVSMGQTVRDGEKSTTLPSQKINLNELLNPSLLSQLPLADKNTRKSKTTHISKTAKFFLGIGADLIRGSNENIPLYSLENGWKYPGPTNRYPETVSEFESFLERYDRYKLDTN